MPILLLLHDLRQASQGNGKDLRHSDVQFCKLLVCFILLSHLFKLHPPALFDFFVNLLVSCLVQLFTEDSEATLDVL